MRSEYVVSLYILEKTISVLQPLAGPIFSSLLTSPKSFLPTRLPSILKATYFVITFLTRFQKHTEKQLQQNP